MSKQFNKTIGNINNLDDYSCQNATIQNLTVSNIIDSVFVSSSNNLISNNIIVGDTGSKTIKTTGITIDSSNNITGVNNITSSLGTITTNYVQSNTGSNLNLLSSSGNNVNIDATNEKIILSTLDELGVQLIQNSSSTANWIALCIRNGLNGQQMVVEGIINQGVEDKACIGCNTGYPTPTAWAPLYLNNGVAGTDPIVIGQNITISTALASNAVLYASGNIRTDGSYLVGANVLSDLSRNVTTNNLTINGSITCASLYRTISSYAGLNIAYSSSLTNYMIVLPSNLSTSLLKKADFYYALSGLTGTAGAGVAISLVDQNNSTISGTTITTNGAGRISFGNNNTMNNTAYLNLNITWQTGVSAGTLVIQSYALSIGL